SRHGQPGWSNRRRQPVRSPSSARRPTEPGSPVTSATSAHSPERKYSRGRRASTSTALTPVTGKDINVGLVSSLALDYVILFVIVPCNHFQLFWLVFQEFIDGPVAARPWWVVVFVEKDNTA